MSKIAKLGDLVFGITPVICIIYAVYSRNLDSLVHYVGALAVINVMLVCGFLVTHWLLHGPPKPSRQLKLGIFIYIPIFALYAGFALYGIGVTVNDLYHYAYRAIPTNIFATTITVIGVIFLSVALFAFRLKARFFFGLGEATFGLLIAIQRVPLEGLNPVDWDSNTYIVLITAGVFLVVRGLDNMHTGLKPESFDSVLAELKRRGEIFDSRYPTKRTSDDEAPK